MAKELPFFKFEISEWMFGRIQKQSLDVQGMFINLCCKYWHKLGELMLSDAILDFGEVGINSLLKSEIIGSDQGVIFIKFLDIQLDECDQLSKKNRINGLKSAAARAQRKLTTVERSLTTPQPLSTEEKRREEKREKDIHQISSQVFDILQIRGTNTMDVTYMVKQWIRGGHTEIIEHLKAMKAYYANRIWYSLQKLKLLQSHSWMQIGNKGLKNSTQNNKKKLNRMENNTELNQTSLEAQSQAPSVESLDDFDKAIRFLSELPTDRAMKDISKGKYITESIKKVVEVMAFSKMDIVKALRLMNAREKALELALSATMTADKAMADFVTWNPNYEIDIKAK